MNYLLTLKYDGSRYHGWQRQDNALTVQECVEDAVFRLFGVKASVTGCSRTDTGVHANCFRCNFRAEKVLPHKSVVSGMNHFHPDDIAVISSEEVPDDFNARFNCKSKEYIYVIYNGALRDPFYNNRAFHYKFPLDEKMLDKEAKDYIGTHDFTAFRAAGATTKTTERTVISAGVERHGDLVIFRVEADGFLYNMVRIMVGTLININEGKIKKGTIPDIIASKDRQQAGKTQVPDGLYLNKVQY